MTSLKNYFKYIFKKSQPRLFICIVIALLITVSTVDVFIYDYDGYHSANVSFGWISVILGVLCFLTPILELEPFKNRRNIDALFSLPVSRLKMGIAHYMNGIVHIVSVFTLCSAYTFIYLLSKGSELNAVKFIPYYFLSLLFGIFLYSFVSFVFYQGNTVADGTIFILSCSFIFMLFASALNTLKAFDNTNIDSGPYSAFGPITGLAYGYTRLIEKESAEYYFNTQRYISFAFWTVIGILSILGFLYAFANKKAEDVGEISNTIFGYKVLIPAYSYLLLFISEDFNITHLLIILAAYVAFIIYRRTIRLRRSDYICLAASIIPIVLYSIL